MTEQEQNIAIAEECGLCVPHWQFDGCGCRCSKCGKVDYAGGSSAMHDQEHNYVHDLNAMHLAELGCLSTGNNRLNPDEGEESDWDHYIWELERIVGRGCAEEEIYAFAINSTAAQRAEAFLRTVGKWREE